jgi:hypothetical protein
MQSFKLISFWAIFELKMINIKAYLATTLFSAWGLWLRLTKASLSTTLVSAGAVAKADQYELMQNSNILNLNCFGALLL